MSKRIQQTIQTKILNLASGTVKTGIKKLTNRAEFRLRVGDYRILYTVDEKTLSIEAIGHRKDIYL